MKKKILLFTAVIGIACLTFSSYTEGPAAGSPPLNRTGAQASSTTCGDLSTGCHGGTSSATTVTITVDSGTTSVTHYVPGKVYTIKIHGTNTSSNPNFGFEFASVSGTGASQVQAGVASSLPANVASQSISGTGLNFIEHSSPLTATSAGVYDVSFQWTAPSTGVSSITLYCTLNAVNGDGAADAQDQSNNTSVVLAQEAAGPTSVAGIVNNISINAFPNPVSNMLNLQLNDAQTGSYAVEVFDLSGRSVANENMEVSNANQIANINTGNWLPGMYSVVIEKDGNRQVIPVVKQ